jgi:DtxR family Mn-dependent transcriptional regulator
MTDTGTMTLSASLEDYLEAIFRIVQDKHVARAKDVGRRLKVGRSSVTGALHALADRHLINYAPYDLITLTERGQAVARDVVRRHEALRDFFVKVLAVETADADAAACKLEHAIPEVVLQRFVEFVEFVDRCPRGGSQWIKGFGHFCHNDKQTGNCEKCVELVLDEIRSKPMTETKDAGATVATLASLKPGTKAAIVKTTGAGGIRRRLLDMGATAGTIVEVERVAPLGDPIEVKIKGYRLTLRKQEAAGIRIEPL